MMITRAAIMYPNGEIFEGHDYVKIASLANKLNFSGDRIEGFITSSGEFVLPNDAAVIATEAGQLQDRIDELSPDVLWPSLIIE